MANIDFLSALVSGGAKGALLGRDLKRQLAEAKRKALMEDRELAVKESEASSLGGLRSAQIEELLANKGKILADTQSASEAKGRALTRIDPSSEGFKRLRALGINEPTYSDLSSNDALIREILGQEGMNTRERLSQSGQDRRNREDIQAGYGRIGMEATTKNAGGTDPNLKVLLDAIGPPSDTELIMAKNSNDPLAPFMTRLLLAQKLGFLKNINLSGAEGGLTPGSTRGR